MFTLVGCFWVTVVVSNISKLKVPNQTIGKTTVSSSFEGNSKVFKMCFETNNDDFAQVNIQRGYFMHEHYRPFGVNYPPPLRRKIACSLKNEGGNSKKRKIAQFFSARLRRAFFTEIAFKNTKKCYFFRAPSARIFLKNPNEKRKITWAKKIERKIALFSSLRGGG